MFCFYLRTQRSNDAFPERLARIQRVLNQNAGVLTVREFARSIDQHLAMPLLWWDERWSTVAVERAMIDADLSRAKRHELVDKLAAAHILQGAIDALMTATL